MSSTLFRAARGGMNPQADAGSQPWSLSAHCRDEERGQEDTNTLACLAATQNGNMMIPGN